ncbi:hypothetical protein HP546_16770 [Pseudomonas sp. CM25]|uniref:hypothetical protein n=1 Tax=Pseudomonas sp. CM25 TaxID=2738448 RepID=UPI001556648B|nr:hypothetical protein [Pseudomonas sp. CM25]NQD56998.1 hypothetical protein [Pseudomonas sp. CM25]
MSLPGAVPPSAPVTVDGVASIDEELKGFAAYVKSKYPNTTSTALQRPYIDDVIHPAATEDFGISDELVEDSESTVTVLVALDAKTAEQDYLGLFWGGNLVAGGKITSSEAGKYKTFKIEGKKIPEGSSFLKYTVYKAVGGAFLESPTVSTLFRRGQPGVKGTQGVGLELSAPVVALPASSVIGQDEAKAGIKVTILAYLSMNENDVIYVYWGDQEISHKVTEAQVGKPIELMVPEGVVKAEGDSKSLPVYYYVADVVGNESEWSEETKVEVNTEGVTLSAPEVLSGNGAVITTGEIETASISLDYVALQFPGKFQVGDSLLLHWVGTTEQGQSTSKNFGPLIVQDSIKPQQVQVPYDQWWPLGGGSAQFSYTLTPKTGVPITSKKGYINVTGMASLLPVPTIHKTEGGWVDPDLKFINVLIPLTANFQAQDEITLVWHGTKSEGSPLSIPVKKVPVTSNMVGSPIAIRLAGLTFLKVLEGGFVKVSYHVARGKQVFKSETATYEIGDPVESLPAPATELPLINSTLDPDNDEYEFNMVIEIPEGAEQPAPCTIYLHWETSEGDYYRDELKVSKDDNGPFRFTVPRSVYELEGAAPVEMTVYYAVEWPGKPIAASADFVFTVATAAMQKNFIGAPVVPLEVGGKLNLTPIIDNLLPVRVDHPSLALGDEVVIKVGNYSSGKMLLTSAGAKTFNLPLDRVLAQNMKSLLDSAAQPLAVRYELVRNGTTQVTLSNVLNLQLIGAVSKENFESVGARTLPLGAVLECPGLTVTVTRGHCSLLCSRCDGWYPTWGNIISTGHGAHIKFTLRGLAKAISFDIADDFRGAHKVRFYTAAGTVITTIPAPKFSDAKPAGYRPHSTRVSFTSPSSAIKSFEFMDGGTNVHLDNIRYTPF